ncbi:DUF421 domain-containing protein [Salinimicrobium gaetbulicola]|uniref:DUF421 domain-containing protein n=1 Tax=Salinimicrobium gaetbulicola TaxID=999702 RepID=A0ABW3IG18_9FLAO
MEDQTIFFWAGWEPILRVIVVGIAAYLSIVFILRVSGKRTLAKISAFDMIIMVAIGSVFGRVLTAKSLSLSEAITAFMLLAVLQYLFATLERKSKFFKRLISTTPILLFYNDEFLERNLRKERLDKSKVVEAARKEGFGRMEDVAAVILEIDASFSVIGKTDRQGETTFEEVLDRSEM